MISAPRTNRPAAAATAAPLPRVVSLPVTSALASSISSRTRSCARSLTSWIAWAMLEGWSLMRSTSSVLPPGEALEHDRGDEAAGERRAHELLGVRVLLLTGVEQHAPGRPAVGGLLGAHGGRRLRRRVRCRGLRRGGGRVGRLGG